eukprot:scaffold115227_cov57-Phaeocystis_antarctica.AAC.2
MASSSLAIAHTAASCSSSGVAPRLGRLGGGSESSSLQHCSSVRSCMAAQLVHSAWVGGTPPLSIHRRLTKV